MNEAYLDITNDEGAMGEKSSIKGGSVAHGAGGEFEFFGGISPDWDL